MSIQDNDISGELQEQVRAAGRDDVALRIVGGDSKAFYGRSIEGRELALSGHRGVVNYEPTELVITVRGGTPLADLGCGGLRWSENR